MLRRSWAAQSGWRASAGHALAFGAGFAACQHGIGQGEFCQRFTGIRLEKHKLVAAFDVVHAEGDVAVEVTAGLDFAGPHARIAKGRGEEHVAQLVLQADFKRGERIFGLIQNVQRQRNFGHFAERVAVNAHARHLHLQTRDAVIFRRLIGHGHGGQFQRLAEFDVHFSAGLEHDAFTLRQHGDCQPGSPTNGRSTRRGEPVAGHRRRQTAILQHQHCAHHATNGGIARRAPDDFGCGLAFGVPRGAVALNRDFTPVRRD